MGLAEGRARTCHFALASLASRAREAGERTRTWLGVAEGKTTSRHDGLDRVQPLLVCVGVGRKGNSVTMRRLVLLGGLLASAMACESSSNGDATSASGGALPGTGG